MWIGLEGQIESLDGVARKFMSGMYCTYVDCRVQYSRPLMRRTFGSSLLLLEFDASAHRPSCSV